MLLTRKFAVFHSCGVDCTVWCLVPFSRVIPKMLLLTIGALLALYFAYCIIWRFRTLRTFKRLNIPGPAPSFLWGNIFEIYKNGHLVMQRKWHEQYGPVVGYYFGLFPVLLVSDAELLKQILLKDFHNFADRSEIVNGRIGGDLDNSLIVLQGQRWKEVRSILTPSFTSKKLKRVTPEVCATVDEFMKNVDKDFANSAECDIYDLYQALTLDTICKSGMGVDFGVQNDVKNSKILEQCKAMLAFEINSLVVTIFSFPMLLDLAGKLITTLNYRAQNSGKNPVIHLKEQCRDVVKQRRLNPEQSQRSDLLQLMMDAQSTALSAINLSSLIAGHDPETEENTKLAKNEKPSTECPFARKPQGLKDSEVIENALLVLLAGFETTSSTLAFITKLLLRFPEVQEKVREELIEATDNGRVFDFDRVQRCPYTEAVVQETLRMYPPVYFLQARVAADEMKYGSLTIPKGISVFISVNELHHNEQVFSNPREFQPERFLPENKTPEMAWSWQPFGAGPRNCIGLRFAQMEIKITLAKLLTKYRISSESEPKHDPFIKTVVKPVLQQIQDPVICKLELI